MKKLIIIISTLFLIINISSAQKLRYDDIFNLIKQKNYSRAYSLLFDYQNINPEFINTYFQLGNISFFWALKSDPFKDLEQTEYYIHNTKLFYGLALGKLKTQEKDAQRNSKYYKNTAKLQSYKKLDNLIVSKYISDKLDSINNYSTAVHKSVYLLNKTVATYKKTVALFTNIITSHPNITDLYLIQQDSILKSTNKLILLYDSTLYYFNELKKSLKSYPILNYKQKIYPQQIKTYRLQGLTKTDFLNNKIIIWNYKKWAQDIQKELVSNINHFRETISKTNKIFTEKENKISQYDKYSNTFKPISLDQKIYFEIEKYDNNSLITKLFEYQTARINLLVLYKRIFNDTSNISINTKKRQIELYKLILKKQKADSLLLNFKTNITKQDYLKHKDFFDYNYNGFSNLKTYANKQKALNQDVLHNSINNALFFTYRDVFFIPQKHKVKYKDSFINIFVQKIDPDDAPADSYITTAIARTKTGEKFITGYYKTKTGSNAFTAKISVSNEIEWLKPSNTGLRATEYGTNIYANLNECFVIIHSIYNSKHYNTLVKLNNDGKQIFNHKLQEQNIARFFKYDEISNNALIAFQGNKLDYFTDNATNLTLKKINLTNKTQVLWKKNITLDGKIINIIKIDTNYHIFANYHLLSFGKTNFVNNKENIIHIITDSKGNYISAKDINSKFFIFGLYAYKINSNIISIVGITKKTDIFKTQKFSELPPCYYIIINKNNKTIFENF